MREHERGSGTLQSWQFAMVSSCLPSTTVWAHPVLTGLCLLAKTPPPSLLGLSSTKLLPQGISLPCCPSTTHSSLGAQLRPMHQPAPRAANSQTWDQARRLVRRATLRGVRRPALVSLGRVASRGKASWPGRAWSATLAVSPVLDYRVPDANSQPGGQFPVPAPSSAAISMGRQEKPNRN